MMEAVQVEIRVGPDTHQDGSDRKDRIETVEIGTHNEDLFAVNTPPLEGVEYRVEYRHVDDRRLIHSIITSGMDFEPVENVSSRLFDIVTTFVTQDDDFSKRKEQGGDGHEVVPRITDTRKSIDMHLHSPAIIHALRSVVKYYPRQSLLGEEIIISHPYPILVHHEKELKQYMENCKASAERSIICPKERNAYHEIKILQKFLEEAVMPAVKLERERNKRGLETFDMMWLRLKPGATILARDTGSVFDYGKVISYVTGGILASAWYVGEWSLDYNGEYLGTCTNEYAMRRFEGEREIEISVIDDSAFEGGVDESVKNLVERGKKFYDLLSKKCQHYKGKMFGFPFNELDALVMVDMKTYYSEEARRAGRAPVVPDVSLEPPDKSWVTDCLCPVCRERKEESANTGTNKEMFQDYHGIFPEENDALTPHQMFLLPPQIYAFLFKTRTWEELRVESFSEPKFQQQLIDNLVMDLSRIKTLKALASSYIRENKDGVVSAEPAWSADFIQGKGRGQIILLHGPPGVGKTCTAECIAEYSKRPLMILTSSDIGADPKEIESVLSKGFKRASSWGAVLLIDEADVFMEERSTNDLTRNCLVAGFLRALEYYDGILFLTTNRIGTFDDAFISRIHVKLYYRPFTAEERQRVWRTFIEKLTKERGGTMRVSIDAKDFIKGRQMRELEWNGREIRNAFQTAVALAEYDAETDEEGKILLKDTHLSSIVDMSKDFKHYVDNMHGGDEGKRSFMKKERYDNQGASN